MNNYQKEKKDRFSGLGTALTKFMNLFIDPIEEVVIGFTKGSIPWAFLLLLGAVPSFLIVFKLDLLIYEWFRGENTYPFYHPYLYYSWYVFCNVMPFWLWGCLQKFFKWKFLKKVSPVFLNAGLINRLDQLPNIIADETIDEYTRRMVLDPNGISVEQFKRGKGVLENSLGINIDDFEVLKHKGVLRFNYSAYPMPEKVEFGSIDDYMGYSFMVGHTRSSKLSETFKEIPHLLIAGQTGGGKSTFLRQLITTTYVNNKRSEFLLIDLKGGMEFQTFEGLNRITVAGGVTDAISRLSEFESQLDDRMSLLKDNKCKDIDAYIIKANKQPEEGEPKKSYKPLNRIFIVVDEAAELFLSGAGASPDQSMKARGVLSKIARQGRAIGIHLIIATQRPDKSALDTQVKANLAGTLCFKMGNDASSMTVLGNGRATDLPAIAGRAIWKVGGSMVEVQTPFLDVDGAEDILKSYKAVAQPKSEEESSDQSKEATDSEQNDNAQLLEGIDQNVTRA